MELNNIEKIPLEYRGILEKFVSNFVNLYGEEIVSIFLYGSAATPDYNPKTSDINIAIVLKNISFKKLKASLKIIKTGRKHKITVPLFLTREYIKMSLDTFPMEFMNMKDSRCVVYGEDVLSDISADKEDMRRECEYQLKGKLITIRQAYLEQALNRKGLQSLMKTSLRALIPVFQSVLRLKQGYVSAVRKEDILRRLEAEFEVDGSVFLEVLQGKKITEAIVENFLLQLTRLSENVDKR